jgi:hypothetical protein
MLLKPQTRERSNARPSNIQHPTPNTQHPTPPLQAIARCEPLAELVEQDDLQALSFCTDVRVTDDKDYTGFKIEFDFKTNPYFTNTILTKTYKVPNMFEPGEPVLDSVEGTEIAWKPKQVCGGVPCCGSLHAP